MDQETVDFILNLIPIAAQSSHEADRVARAFIKTHQPAKTAPVDAPSAKPAAKK